MKLLLTSLFSSFLCLTTLGQDTIKLKPSSIEGKDALIYKLGSNNNYGSSGDLTMYTWTVSSSTTNKRVFIQFNIDTIPLNARIKEVKLSLFYNPTSNENFTSHRGNNDMYIERVTSSWQENTLKWNNQPSISTQNRVSVAKTTSGNEDLIGINVTTLVEDILDTANTNFGFRLRMQNENTAYRALLLASSDHSDTSLHPELIIIYDNPLTYISDTSCNSYLSPSGKYSWNTSGVYEDTLLNSIGRDSIISIDLTISSPSMSTLNIYACESYISPSGDYTWRTSGIFYDTIQKVNGCDSLFTINLEVDTSTSFFMNQISCDQYKAPSGKIYTSGGLLYDTIPNSKACDSIITIFLTIKNSSSSSQTVSSCGAYTSPSNKIYTISGTYNDTLQNAIGCDSIITTILTVHQFDKTVLKVGTQLISNQNNANYQWLDCNNSYAVLPNDTNQSFSSFFSGSYAVEISNNQCIDTSSCYNLIITSIEENEADKVISIYPNPADKFIRIEGLKDLSSVKINAIDGRVVEYTSVEKNSFNTSTLPDGIYFLSYKNKNTTNVKKVIIKH